MKKYNYVNKFRKESIYQEYQHLGIGSERYEKITRAKMAEKILENYLAFPEELETYISFEALELLKALIKSEDLEKTIKASNRTNVFELEGRYLLATENKVLDFFIPDITKEIIKNYEPTGKHQYYDELYNVLSGIMFTRGEINEEDLIDLLIELGYDSENILEDLSNHHRFLFGVEYDALMIYSVYYSLEYGDYTNVEHEYIPTRKYSKEAYKSISKYGLDLTRENQKAFYDLLKENNSDNTIKYVMKSVVNNDDLYLDDLYQWVTRWAKLDSSEDYKELFKLVIDELPIRRFKGDSSKEVLEYRSTELYESERRAILQSEPCPCGSGKNSEDCCLDSDYSISNKALLDEARQNLFYEMNHALISNVNDEFGYVQASDEEDFYNKLTDEDYVYLKDLIHMEENLLEEFQAINDFDDLEIEIIKGLKNAIKDEFIAIKYENQKLVLGNLRTDEVYHISGLSVPLGLIIDQDSLPMMVNTRLIPLSEMIVYDAVITELPIKIGNELKASLEENFKDSIPITKLSDIIKDSTIN